MNVWSIDHVAMAYCMLYSKDVLCAFARHIQCGYCVYIKVLVPKNDIHASHSPEKWVLNKSLHQGCYHFIYISEDIS